MVSLVKNTRPQRRPVRRRDFATTNHSAPIVTRRLSRAYHQEAVPPWRRWLYISVIVFVLGILLTTLYAPIFTIKNIIINNVGFRPTEERLAQILEEIMITRRWQVLPQSNLFFFSTRQARQILATEFFIEEVSFTRHWPNVLKINVAKNVIAAVFRADNGQFLLDRRGILVQHLADSTVEDKALPLVVERGSGTRNLGEQVLAPETVMFIDELYDNWQVELPELLPQYIITEASSLPTLQVNMSEGWYVNVTEESTADSQVESLKRLLAERIKDDRIKLQYIDVRFGNRLYFKLK